MARTVIDAKLTKREQRLRLAPRKEPYWMTVSEGEHLGYYRGSRVTKWLARYRQPGKGALYQRTTLGEADDSADADGKIILNFKQAQDAARKMESSVRRAIAAKRFKEVAESGAIEGVPKNFEAPQPSCCLK